MPLTFNGIITTNNLPMDTTAGRRIEKKLGLNAPVSYEMTMTDIDNNGENEIYILDKGARPSGWMLEKADGQWQLYSVNSAKNADGYDQLQKLEPISPAHPLNDKVMEKIIKIYDRKKVYTEILL